MGCRVVGVHGVCRVQGVHGGVQGAWGFTACLGCAGDAPCLQSIAGNRRAAAMEQRCSCPVPAQHLGWVGAAGSTPSCSRGFRAVPGCSCPQRQSRGSGSGNNLLASEIPVKHIPGVHHPRAVKGLAGQRHCECARQQRCLQPCLRCQASSSAPGQGPQAASGGQLARSSLLWLVCTPRLAITGLHAPVCSLDRTL